MRPDPDAIEASLPGDHAVALLAAEVRRLQAVITQLRSSASHISEAGNSLAAAAEIARLRGDAAVRYHLHYAVPDAIAVADRGRNDNAVTRPGEGTGNTLAPTLVAAYADQDATLSVQADNEQLRAENARLREAIRRLADQDATLSVQGGNVTVTMDATLTDAERDALHYVVGDVNDIPDTAEDILRGLLDRTQREDTTPSEDSVHGEGTK